MTKRQITNVRNVDGRIRGAFTRPRTLRSESEGAMSKLAEAIESLRRCMATDPRDLAAYRRDAWMYAIVFGWGDKNPEHDCWANVASQHGWDAETLERVKGYAAAFEEAVHISTEKTQGTGVI